MPSIKPAFHLAFPVPCLEEARGFFSGLLECAEGRSASRWVDFDFHGHQLSAHLVSDKEAVSATNAVDGDTVPTRHFGLILPWDDWETLGERLAREGAIFVIEPKIRFRGKPGEQGTMFIRGPGNNVLEFKTFRDMNKVFSR
jgi:extradiol dioxygenase family protein